MVPIRLKSKERTFIKVQNKIKVLKNLEMV